MSKKADNDLLRAVLEPRKPGALRQIENACAAGADANGICPETSAAGGRVRGGSTLLTHAIHESASNAVQKLLECGADPNLEDENGWTPWMASTLADESKRARIQEALRQHGARPDREHVGQLIRAVFEGNLELAAGLVQSDDDFRALSTFRVDLLGHQVANHNAPMLELLLTRNMQPTSTHLLNAVRSTNLAAVDLLLRHGVPPEDADDTETPLMTAAAMGNLEIVQRLVAAGADVNRSDPDNIEWTAAFCARRAGKSDVADWLVEQMDPEVSQNLERLRQSRDPRFQALYDHATAGEGVSTDDIVGTLQQWDERYGVGVEDASPDSVTIVFGSVPDKVEALLDEIFTLCPDAVDNQSALRQELQTSKTLFLWWD